MNDSERPPAFRGSEPDAIARDALVRQIRRDFGAITERYRTRVFAVCRRIVGDDELARDLTQEAFTLAFERLDQFEGRSDIGSWLCGIGKYTALAAVRRRREALTDDGIVEPSDPAMSALKEIGRAEREGLIRQAAESCLDAVEQEIAYLRYVECLPRERIAELLELGDAEAVRVHLQRIKRRLQEAVRTRLEQLRHGTSFVRTSW